MGCCCAWRTPRSLRYVLPAIIVGIIVYLYSSFTCYAQPLLLSAGVHWGELLSFHVMTLLLCASLAQCLLSSDSFVEKNTLVRRKNPPHQDQRADGGSEDALLKDSEERQPAQQLQPGEFSMVESKMNGEIRYCRKCRAVKPDRAHHCSTCRRCVLKMDHHCIYINKYVSNACPFLIRCSRLTMDAFPGLPASA